MCLAYSKMRNLDEKPYSQEEAEAAKYLMELTGLDGGDDPVGFLIASHREPARQRTVLRTKHRESCPALEMHLGDDARSEPHSCFSVHGSY